MHNGPEVLRLLKNTKMWDILKITQSKTYKMLIKLEIR